MDEGTRSQFQRLADQLGWLQHKDLNAIEEKLHQSVVRSRRPPSDSCKHPALSLQLNSSGSPSDCHSCAQELVLTSSEDESELRQEESKTEAMKGKSDWDLQNPDGIVTISDSSDDENFEIFIFRALFTICFLVSGSVLNQMKTPKSGATARICQKTPRSKSVPEIISDSSGDEEFEKFLIQAKTPRGRAHYFNVQKKDNSLKDFIVSDDVLLDGSDGADSGNDGKKHNTACQQPDCSKKGHKLTYNFSVETACSSNPSVERLELSNDSDDGFIASTWRDQVLEKRLRKKGDEKQCAHDQPKSGSISFAVSEDSYSSSKWNAEDTRQPRPLVDTADSSSDEFESLLERIKNKIKITSTPASILSHSSIKKTTSTAPVERKPSNKILGVLQRPRGRKNSSPNSIQLSVPIREVLSELTPSQVAGPKLPSLSDPRGQHEVYNQFPTCHIPGCFLQDLTLSSSKYVKKFKQNQEELIQKLYTLYNWSVFEQKLPEKMEINWNKKMRKTAGYCVTGQKRENGLHRYARVELSEKVCDSAERLRDTLIHELCHAATWLINGVRDGHGRFWQLYAKKSIVVHPELPMVTRCHTYKINYKYTYQCSKCKNMIGRHSKSLDTQRFACALCTGVLVLLPAMKKDGTPAKKELTPFAKFVKENYGSAKKDLAHTRLTHAEVMRKLSADFTSKAKVVDF
eukprot:gi/632982021/ref/XP_007907908.1/ PREDICTED: acidic repeat-containing protein isoform X1 [Callorhinchus milii]